MNDYESATFDEPPAIVQLTAGSEYAVYEYKRLAPKLIAEGKLNKYTYVEFTVMCMIYGVMMKSVELGYMLETENIKTHCESLNKFDIQDNYDYSNPPEVPSVLQ